MNRRMIFYMIGQVMLILAGLMVLPLAVSLIYRESCYSAFLMTIGITLLVGLLMMFLSKPESKVIYAKEGFVIVALSWIILSAIGALPFVITGEIPSFVDAYFEIVSGFTTTGASILTDVEAMSKGLLFWRSFTHWIGGMGVIVFVMAIVPQQNDRNMHVMRAEVPGPTVGKMVPRLRDTARMLYILYIGLGVIETIFLLLGGMNLYESLVHMFGTAGTGGFGVRGDSIASYNGYLQWVITIFMMLFGINFNLYYMIVRKHPKEALRSEEMHYFVGIWLGATVIITALLFKQYGFGGALTKAGFQVASIMTTTGYATADFNQWPQLARMILLMLMLVGACAGSTGGGFKIARVVMLGKIIKREVRHLLHPRSVGVVKFEDKAVDEKTLSGVSAYLAIYMLVMIVGILLLSFDKMDAETNITAMISCFNNIGPGLGAVIGPAGNYSSYSAFSKIVLTVSMLLGRLEVYPLLIAMTPSTWSRKA